MDIEGLDPDFVWERKWVGRPAGTHFSANGTSPLARSDETNLLETQAIFGGDVDDETEQSDLPKVIVGLGVGALATFLAVKVAPGLLRRWRGAGVPPVALETPTTEGRDNDVLGVHVGSASTFASTVETVVNDTRSATLDADAHRRIVEVMLAAAVIADNLRALSAAQLDDDAHTSLRNSLTALAAPDVVEIVNSALAADPSLLDEQTSGRVIELFGGGKTVDGRYLPLRGDEVAKVLAFPRSA